MLAKRPRAIVVSMPQPARSKIIDVLDALDDAKDLAQAMIMAAEGATGCDDVEIAAIGRLAFKVAQDIRRARSLVEQAVEGVQ